MMHILLHVALFTAAIAAIGAWFVDLPFREGLIVSSLLTAGVTLVAALLHFVSST